jgi:hypothetical protein
MMANPATGVAFDIKISECVISNSPVPKWLRQRLEDSLESKTKSLDDIETRLKEAELRRQVVGLHKYKMRFLSLQLGFSFADRAFVQANRLFFDSKLFSLQQFHEWLANKARPKRRVSPPHSGSEDLAQRLEAKLSAAEQKR